MRQEHGEKTRFGMWDHVRGLEEEECWIGIQKRGRMDMTDLYYTPARVRDVLPPKSAQLSSANNGMPT